MAQTRISARKGEILHLDDVALTVVTGDFGIDALRARSDSLAFFHARALDCAGRDSFLHPLHQRREPVGAITADTSTSASSTMFSPWHCRMSLSGCPPAPMPAMLSFSFGD